MGEHHEKAVPVVAEREPFQDFPAKPLHGVQIRDGDVEDPAGEPVVHRRDRPLVVIPDLTARDDVPPFGELVEEAGDFVGAVLQIGVEQREVGTLRRPGTGDHGLGLAEVGAVAHDLEQLPAVGLLLRDARRVVAGPVVHQDDLSGEPVSRPGLP